MQLFYAPHIESETYILNLDESKHCVRVLRKKKGDFVQLVDGKGAFIQLLFQTQILNNAF